MQAFKLKVLVADDSKLIHDVFEEIAASVGDPVRHRVGV